MRSLQRFSSDSVSSARTRLAAGFHQHVAIALVACLLGLVLG
jgi:hypothetical protein